MTRQDFDSAVKIESDAFEIRLSLANLLHKQGHVREAIEQYENLRMRRPNDDRVFLALTPCWQEESRLNEAREIIDLLRAKQPDSVAGLVERSRLALRTNDPGAAEHWLRQAIDDRVGKVLWLRVKSPGQL